MLTNAQFDRARRLALSLAGIELHERHRELLERRSKRLGCANNTGLDSLLSAVERNEPTATGQLLSLLTTKCTGFFRHPQHFRIAAEHALRAAHQHGQVRLWSAAAATGEEPYSLAMALIEAFGCDKPPAHVLATDVDAEALEVGKRGEYGEVALRGLDTARRERFLSPGSDARRWRIAPSVRHLVEFRSVNLANEAWAVEAPIVVIFCRNVLMYLEDGRRQAVLGRMASLLAPQGLLFIDPTEHLGKAGVLFSQESSAVYRSRGSSHPKRNATEV
jgi:chemotaxis protein methyltransferase CheR